jgi:hypothetical protein
MALSPMTVSIMGLYATLKLNSIECTHAECHVFVCYAECRYVECHYP